MAGLQFSMPCWPRKKAAKAVASILVILLTALLGGRAERARARSADLRTDLSLLFVCKKNEQTAVEKQIEQFLSHEGFDALNQARTDRERGAPNFFGIFIFGLDEKRRVLTINALPPEEGRYGATLITPPPTHRSTTLEDALLKFVGGQLGCETRLVSRHENGAELMDAYEDYLKVIEGFFLEAGKIRGPRGP